MINRYFSLEFIEFLLLLLSSLIYNGSKLILDLGAAKLLSVSQYGDWAFAILIVGYLINVHLGILNGIAREISVELGKGGDDRVALYKSAGLKVVIFLIFIVTTVFSIWELVSVKVGGFNYLLLPVLFSGLIFYQFVQSSLRAEQKFNISSYHQAVSGFLLLPIFFLMYLYKDTGLIVGFGASLLLTSLYFVKYLNINLVKINKQAIFKLLKIGFPIFYIGLLYLFFTSIDRIMVQYYLGSNFLAIYHFSNTLFTVGLLFITVLGTQFYPKILYEYGKYKKITLVRKLLGKQIKIAILMSLFLACILIILISNFIPIFFEKYHSSVSPSIILILGLPGLSLSFVLSSFYTVIMKQYRLIPIMIIPLLINVVMAWWFFNNDYGLDGFAISTTVSIYLYAIFMLWDYKKLKYE